MAKLTVDGLDDLILSFQEIEEIPDDILNEMLDAEAEIVAPAIREEAAKLGMYDGYSQKENRNSRTDKYYWRGPQVKSYSTGELARSVRVGKMKTQKGVRQKYIYFAGSRKRGKKTVRNSEIAFLNEYGTRNINQRNFIWVAIKKTEDAAVKASAAVYDKWLKSKNL